MRVNYEQNTWLCPAPRGTFLFLARCKSKKRKIPLILLVTCSFDVIIWSMSVRSLASRGTFWTSHASNSALYCPVVWHNTCLYTASEICRENHFVRFWFVLIQPVVREQGAQIQSSRAKSSRDLCTTGQKMFEIPDESVVQLEERKSQLQFSPPGLELFTPALEHVCWNSPASNSSASAASFPSDEDQSCLSGLSEGSPLPD